MDVPVLLPHHLAYLKKVDNENDMLKILAEEPSDLIIFFERAVSDEAWAWSHQTILKKILTWMTYHFFHGALAIEIAERVRACVFEYQYLLGNILPKDFAVIFEERIFPANSLMFGLSSPILLSYLRSECMDKGKDTLTITDASIETIEAAIEYIHYGKVEDLWKKDWTVVLNILREAADWEMEGLVHFCANVYKRYIHRGNALSILKMSHENGWRELKNATIEFINDLDIGITFTDRGVDELSIVFHRYSKEALEYFSELSDLVTFVGFERELVENSAFSEIISKTPSLIGVSLENTVFYSDRLSKLPAKLEQLDLGMCEWLDEESFEKLIETCPHIKVLILNSNIQLDYHSWSQLNQLDNLEHLELARCHQIGDSDFILIIKGCSHLRILNIEGCSHLTDDSLVELSFNISTLVEVNLSRTAASDATITELAHRNRQLQILKLERCKGITDHGITEVVKMSPNLKVLELTASSISTDAVEGLKIINPHLQVHH